MSVEPLYVEQAQGPADTVRKATSGMDVPVYASRFTSEIVIAARRLLRAPAFAISAVVLLGCGLGVGAVFLNLLNGAFFKTITGSGSVVRVSYRTPGGGAGQWAILTDDTIARIRMAPPESLSWLAGHNSVRTTLVIQGTPRPARVDSVSGPYFETFGAVPLIGRLLGGADEDSREPTAVISEPLWRSVLGGDPAILGTTILVAEQPVTIVGVVALPFKGLAGNILATDAWVPSHVLRIRQLFGRLRDGITIQQANAEFATRYAELEAAERNRVLEVEQGLFTLPSSAYALIFLALAVGALVAAVAGASLTLILLARLSLNRAEIAIRLTLGASARDITRLLAIEVGLIGIAAAFLALLVSTTLANVAASYLISVSGMGTVALDTSPDLRLLGYMCLVTLGIAFGVIVILADQTSRVDALMALSSAAGVGGATSRMSGTRTRLIASQVAVVTALLLLATAFVRSTLAGLAFDPGFDVRGVAIAWIDQTGNKGDEGRVRMANRRALEVARQARGVTLAALATRIPGGTPGRSSRARSEGAELHWIQVQSITADFFDVIQLPVKRGRGFLELEESNGAAVAVVSESVAAMFWPQQDPIGRLLWFEGTEGFSGPVQIIGVVSAPRVAFREATLRRDVFVPFGYEPETDVAVIAKGRGQASAVLHSLRIAAKENRPSIGFLSSRTLEEELAGTMAAVQLVAAALGILGITGLFIAAAGLYGVAAQLAVDRRKEVGIRKALGATNLALWRMIVSESLRTFVLGTAIGIVVAVLLGFQLRHRFPNVQPFDWFAVAGVSGFLLVVGLLAAVLPFRKILCDSYAQLREL